MPAQAKDILELDELYSVVGSKANKRWLWVALCRRTRQVVAYVLGDRNEAPCKRLFRRIPLSYHSCATYSDFWAASAKVFQTGGINRWTSKAARRLMWSVGTARSGSVVVGM